MTRHRARSPSRTLGVFLCLSGAQAAAAGCYTYREVPLTGVAPGSTVRTQLSPEARIRLEEYFPETPQSIVGEVVGTDDGGIVLLTRTGGSGLSAAAAPPLRQRIAVGSREIVGVEERVLDRKRTFGLTSALAAGSAVLVWHFLKGEGRGAVEIEPPPGPVNSVIGVRLPLPAFLGGGGR